jgi:CRP-like cAMP-binding protein
MEIDNILYKDNSKTKLIIRKPSRQNSKSRIHVFSEGHVFPNDNYEVQIPQLIELLQKEIIQRTPNDMVFILKYLNATELMNKFKKEKLNELAYNNLMYGCGSNLFVKFLKQGEHLFRIDDIGDKFYIVIKGCVDVFKPVAVSKKMNFGEYYDHLKSLRNIEETHLLVKTLNMNMNFLPIFELREFDRRCLQIFKMRIEQCLYEKLSPEEVCKIIKLYNIPEEDIDPKFIMECFEEQQRKLKEQESRRKKTSLMLIKIKDLDLLEEICPKNWIDYVKERMENIGLVCEDNGERSPISSTIQIQKFQIDTERAKVRKDVVIFQYERVLQFKEGQYFGDYALDSQNKKRTASIIAHDYTILGHISNDVYEQYIYNEKYKIKLKEVGYLNEQFFLYPIKSVIFEKKFFNLFILSEYSRGEKLLNGSELLNKLLFIKDGIIDITFKGSILELSSLMKHMSERLLMEVKSEKYKVYNFEGIDYNELLQYLDESKFNMLKYKSKDYLTYLSVKRKFNLFRFSLKEICGLEDLFLGFPYSNFQIECHSEKVIVYELSKEKLNNIFIDEKNTIFPFAKMAINKIINLLKRLSHMKNTYLQIFMLKQEKDLEININKNYSFLSRRNSYVNSIPISNMSLSPSLKDIQSPLLIKSSLESSHHPQSKEKHKIRSDYKIFQSKINNNLPLELPKEEQAMENYNPLSFENSLIKKLQSESYGLPLISVSKNKNDEICSSPSSRFQTIILSTEKNKDRKRKTNSQVNMLALIQNKNKKKHLLELNSLDASLEKKVEKNEVQNFTPTKEKRSSKTIEEKISNSGETSKRKKKNLNGEIVQKMIEENFVQSPRYLYPSSFSRNIYMHENKEIDIYSSFADLCIKIKEHQRETISSSDYQREEKNREKTSKVFDLLDKFEYDHHHSQRDNIVTKKVKKFYKDVNKKGYNFIKK